MNLKELSGILGLSTTTVSRALNGYPEVNAETRARVLTAARRYDYAPNQMARRLATGRTHAIGHVIPLATHQMINPLFADFIAGVGETYSAGGYDMILSVVPERDEATAYRAMISQGKVDGVMVHGPKLNDMRIDLLSELDVPFVVHGRDGRDEQSYSWLDMNNRRAFMRATEFLLDLGHRRIALVNGIESLHFARRRRIGFENALSARGIAIDPDLIRGADMTESFGFVTARDMLALADSPTAFVTSSIMIALGVQRALGEAGLRSGRDVSIITHDDDLSFLPNAGPVPMFTATRSSIRQAGRRAAELLLERIADPTQPCQHQLLEADLTVGRSTGPVRERTFNA